MGRMLDALKKLDSQVTERVNKEEAATPDQPSSENEPQTPEVPRRREEPIESQATPAPSDAPGTTDAPEHAGAAEDIQPEVDPYATSTASDLAELLTQPTGPLPENRTDAYVDRATHEIDSLSQMVESAQSDEPGLVEDGVLATQDFDSIHDTAPKPEPTPPVDSSAYSQPEIADEAIDQESPFVPDQQRDAEYPEQENRDVVAPPPVAETLDFDSLPPQPESYGPPEAAGAIPTEAFLGEPQGAAQTDGPILPTEDFQPLGPESSLPPGNEFETTPGAATFSAMPPKQVARLSLAEVAPADTDIGDRQAPPEAAETPTEPFLQRPRGPRIHIRPLADESEEVSTKFAELCHNVLGRASGNQSASFLFAGTGGESSQSHVVTKLACMCAEAGLGSVLFISTMPRVEAESPFVEPAASLGWANLVSGENDLSEFVMPTDTPELSVVPPGSGGSRRAADPRQIRAVLQKAKEHFRFVFVDAGPVGVGDVKTLATICDSTYLVVQSGQTTSRSAMLAAKTLRGAGARLAGSVVTHAG